MDGLPRPARPPRYAGRTMPPSHPRPEDLAALGDALSTTGGHTAEVGELLLDHLVTAGDHATQQALDGFVDDCVDALREISAGARELALGLGPQAARATPSGARTDGLSAPFVRELR